MSSVQVYDAPNPNGGSHTVSIERVLKGGMVECRVWSGRATHLAWQGWGQDGKRLVLNKTSLKNQRILNTLKKI